MYSWHTCPNDNTIVYYIILTNLIIMTAGLMSGKTFRIPSWMSDGCSESVAVLESLPAHIRILKIKSLNMLFALTWSTFQIIVGEKVSLQVCTHQSLMTLTHRIGNIFKISNLSNTLKVRIFGLHPHAPAGD